MLQDRKIQITMKEIGLPCSGGIASVPADMLQSDTPAQQYDHCKLKPDDTSSLTDVTVYEIVSVNVWPSSTTTATILQNPVNNGTADNDNSISFPRKRKIKRPFSPEIHAGGKRLIEKRKGVRKQKGLQTTEVTNIPDVGPNGKPFSCEKCHSPFIVNPARIHRLDPRRKYRPRKITDVVTKQVLLLCNACGLSMSRSRKERHKKEPPTQEEKDSYLKKAAEFAASLAASLQDLDACRLYCPAFKSSACQCLQKYISADGNEVSLSPLHLTLNIAMALSQPENLSCLTRHRPAASSESRTDPCRMKFTSFKDTRESNLILWDQRSPEIRHKYGSKM